MTSTPRAVERLWPGSTVVCLGSGPSLTQTDVDWCRGRARVIAVNDAYRLAPWADALYACDLKWWRWHQGVPSFGGLKFSLEPTVWTGVVSLRNTGREGLELDPTGLKTGHTSGYQVVNVAAHLGAVRIVLLGYDMHGDHFFGSHRDKSTPPFLHCLKEFPTLIEPLKQAGIEIVNCTPGSALRCFPMAPLSSVLSEVAA